MKRYFVPPFFGFWDARPRLLEDIQEHWEETVKKLHQENQANILEGLRREFGSDRFEEKLTNFRDFGYAPMSIVSYHNLFFHHVRRAFIIESYYPALTGACALGERILNHLILDLRDLYKFKPSYKHVYRKASFDDWGRAVDALRDWGVLEPGIGEKFMELGKLRHQSLHFNPETVRQVRQDALSAMRLLKEIIEGQFSAFGTQRWFIRGTAGACFLKKGAEAEPFVRNFYVPQCPLVGYRYAIDFMQGGAVIVFDMANYGGNEIDDGEFARLYNERKPQDLAPTELPPAPGIVTWLLTTGKAERVTLVSAPMIDENPSAGI